MTDEQAVRGAVDRWIAVLNAMLNGDPAPLATLYSHADDTYYMGAEGTYRIGWEALYNDWQAQAAKSTGGTVSAVNVHVMVSGDMAMAAHFTRGKVRMPDGTMNENNVRETSVFRKENGQWRMIGHHADGIAYWEKAFDD
ncbi:MAG: nuclear transport factor 2 family protein [Hyphomicrobiales bacterium]|nr:nuclear transport factor 2 family protein [Hyphomicrobiales bacterium]